MNNALIFASNNKGKITEIQSLVPKYIQITSLQDAGINEEIEEPFFTFNENAWAKADYIFRKTGKDCFAEDSGLVVPALHGEPGVFSARYAGTKATDEENNKKLLEKIQGVQDREAYYQAVICLILQGEIHYFEGRCDGHIITTPRGTLGFGYDPLFIPLGEDRTFAEITLEEKNAISHRAKATHKLATFLRTLSNAT